MCRRAIEDHPGGLAGRRAALTDDDLVTLDFIVDIGNGLNSDQFLWSPKISPSVTATTGAGGDTSSNAWDAQKDFSAQPKSQLNAWEQLVQVLMLSNEFMFVD